MRPMRSRLAVGVAGVVVTASAASAQLPSFQVLPGIPGGGNTAATGVSADGRVVVGAASTAAGAQRGVRWVGPAFALQPLGALPGRSASFATGVSANGQVVVGEIFASSDEESVPGRAFRWTEAAGMTDLGAPANTVASAARGVSADGMTVVGLATPLPDEFFRAAVWRETAGWTVLGTFDGGLESTADAATADGAIVFGSADADFSVNAFTWAFSVPEPAPLFDIGAPPGNIGAFGADIADNGSAAVGFSSGAGGAVGFRYALGDGSFQVIPTILPRTSVVARAISPDGTTVVGELGLEELTDRGFVWTAASGTVDVQRLLEFSGVVLPDGFIIANVQDIAADNRTIVGTGLDSANELRAYIARLPASLALPTACNLADIVSIGGFPPADGELTVDDYTSFINAFAGDELVADIVSIGGFPPADGELTVDDYTSFINAFAEGC